MDQERAVWGEHPAIVKEAFAEDLSRTIGELAIELRTLRRPDIDEAAARNVYQRIVALCDHTASKATDEELDIIRRRQLRAAKEARGGARSPPERLSR
jgi:hypothetical protein